MPDKQTGYEVNDIVSHPTSGVCLVKAIGKLDSPYSIMGDTVFMHLKPLYDEGSVLYIPIDKADDMLRSVMTRDEADQLLSQLNSMSHIDIGEEKQREQLYKEILMNGNYLEIARLIKTLLKRRDDRKASGKDMTIVDSKYLKIAENLLCGEIAVPLEMSRQQAEAYIIERANLPIGQTG